MTAEATGNKVGLEGFVDVGPVASLPSGGRLNVIVNYVGVLLFNLHGHYCAIEDVCTHDGGPLGEGELVQDETNRACQIECPRHGARFEICSGAVKRGPAFQPVPTYAVKIVNDRIFVERPK